MHLGQRPAGRGSCGAAHQAAGRRRRPWVMWVMRAQVHVWALWVTPTQVQINPASCGLLAWGFCVGNCVGGGVGSGVGHVLQY